MSSLQHVGSYFFPFTFEILTVPRIAPLPLLGHPLDFFHMKWVLSVEQ